MKTIYEFECIKEQEIDVSVESTNESNEKITVTKKEKKKVPHKFVIKQPNRSLRDSGSLFYGKMKNFAVGQGLALAAVIENKFGDKDKINELWKELNDGAKKLQELELVKEVDRTDAQKEEHKNLLAQVTRTSNEIQNIQNFRNNLSANTADDYARQKTLEWWVLNLSFAFDGKNYTPFFGEGDFEVRSNKWAEMEETQNSFNDEVIDKFVSLISFYYMYPDIATKEKMDTVLKMWQTEKELAEKNKETEKNPDKKEEEKK